MRKVLIIVSAIVLLAPAAAFAAGGTFTDDDDSVFEADIEWLADAAVTLGCNPPANDNFCPDDNVSRGQMAAFMRRFAAFLGAEDGIVNEADHAVAADSATTADSAATADDADTLDGVSSEDLIPHGEITIRQSTSELTPHFQGGPTTITYSTGGNTLSADGRVVMNLMGPAVLGGVQYGLKSVEYCILSASITGFVTSASVTANSPTDILVTDDTDRTADGCYSLEINHSTAVAYDLFLRFDGGSTMRLSGVQTTWAPASSLPASPASSPTNGPDITGAGG